MNANFSWYKHNANYYDLFDADSIPYTAISDAIGKILNKHHVTTIVDLGCGTGNFYIPLSKQGFRLTGIDISPEMLAVAKSKIRANNLSPNLIQGDIRKPITGKFDAAICLYNVIGDLNYHEFAKVVENMTRSVRNQGIICFDIINYNNVKKYEFNGDVSIEKECISKKLGRLVRKTSQKLDKTNQTLEISQRATAHGKIDKNSVSRCKMYLYTMNQVTNLLEKYGLKTLLIYGSYDSDIGLKIYKPNDPMIGIIATKVHE